MIARRSHRVIACLLLAVLVLGVNAAPGHASADADGRGAALHDLLPAASVGAAHTAWRAPLHGDSRLAPGRSGRGEPRPLAGTPASTHAHENSRILSWCVGHATSTAAP